MRRWLVAGAGFVGLVVVGLPASFILTILLVPLWRWIEADFGIEAIGHSGPAEWCFYLIWGHFVLLALLAWWFAARRGAAAPPESD